MVFGHLFCGLWEYTVEMYEGYRCEECNAGSFESLGPCECWAFVVNFLPLKKNLLPLVTDSCHQIHQAHHYRFRVGFRQVDEKMLLLTVIPGRQPHQHLAFVNLVQNVLLTMMDSRRQW